MFLSFDIEHFEYQPVFIISIMRYYSLYGSLSLPNQTKSIQGEQQTSAFSVRAKNVELMHECFPKHLCMGTASWHVAEKRKFGKQNGKR